MKSSAALLAVLAVLAAGGALVPIPQDGFSRPPSPEGDKMEQKRRGTFTIGEETTYVTGPLDKDGSVDYVAALNERLSKGVTPANNANVLIWKALGPHPQGVTMPPEFFKWLGIPQPPEKGNYFLPLDRFIQERLKIERSRDTEAIYDQQYRAHKGPWTAAECPAIASWLKINEKPVAVAIQAMKRSHYFSPMIPRRTKTGSQSLMSAMLPAVQGCRELTSVLISRAMLRLAQGDSEGAWQDLLACHRLGRLVGRGGTLIEGLVGIAIDSIASHADLVWLDRARPDAKRIEKCLDALRKLPPLASIADKADLTERFVLLEAVILVDRRGTRAFEGLSGGPAKRTDLFTDRLLHDVDWDPALRTVNRWYDRLVAALRAEDYPSRDQELAQIEADAKVLRATLTDPANLAVRFPGGKANPAAKGEAIGDTLISLLMPAVRKVQQADDRARQTADNVMVAFALAWYQREHGRYPEKLESLAPKYLAKVPQDRFSGKALIYRPTDKSYLLYSVGPNGKDEGGQGYNDMPPGDDQSIRMPPPEARK
jgi:hypothetical protein